MTIEDIRKMLFELQDMGYRDFHSRLMPTIDKTAIIGVRTPELRRLAGKLYKEMTEAERSCFMKELPHKYYEENNLHGFFIEKEKDYDTCIKLLDEFLPFVDNWATCDLMNPKVFAKSHDRLIEDIKRWISSEHTYEVRFAIGMLMGHFLDEDFCTDYLTLATSVVTDEYYINMMTAWYVATALAKQYDEAVKLIEQNILPVWVHNKSIQKSIESNRISKDIKDYLRTLKRK